MGDAVAGGREVGDTEYSDLIELTAALGLVPAIPLKLLYRPSDGLRVDGPAAFLGYNVFLFDLIGNRKPPASDGGRGPVLLDLDLGIEPGPVGAQRRSPASCSAIRRMSRASFSPLKRPGLKFLIPSNSSATIGTARTSPSLVTSPS